MKEAVVREFFDAWSVYDRVLDHNYMFHDELYQDLQRFLTERHAKRPLTFLDLGCGSARHLAPALAGCAIDCYVGYDLSETALAHAARNLEGLGGTVELHQGDLLEGLNFGTERFDLIFASFALHHLASPEKTVFFQSAYQRLRDDGALVLIDVARDEDEALPLYLDRYCGWLTSEWTAMSPQEIEAICGHIKNNDFPETASDLYAMAAQAGFRDSFERNRFRWHRTFCFEKSHLPS